MHIQSLPLGLLETNCHVVWNDDGDGYVIDPSGEPERLLPFLKETKVTVRAILLTHAHFDHIGALPELAAASGAPTYLHEADEVIYRSPANCMPPYVGPVQDLPTTQRELPPQLPGLQYELLETPGHTPGGVSFYFADAGVVFGGDCLFRGSIGRTDLPGGDTATLMNSIRQQLLVLPDATRVLSGHGPETLIGAERRHNPFVGEHSRMA